MQVKTLGIVGVGAFGEFMIRHLAPYFMIKLHDPDRDLALITRTYNAAQVDLKTCATCDIVVLAVPVQRLEMVVKEIATWVKPDGLVMDVCSVKVKPAEILSRHLPTSTNIICTHPLFGPQSGRRSIAGLKISLCDVRGQKGKPVAAFLRDKLHLKVIEATPEQHDRDMAYVQGLTHLLGKILTDLELKGIRQTTKTFDLMMEAVSYLEHDSLELFKAIQQENPFVAEALARFFSAAKRQEKDLAQL
ncbi:MAG: prephenate dehydrogenase/arogenate dehydrogenase family protein [Pseudomonadota bacterium]